LEVEKAPPSMLYSKPEFPPATVPAVAVPSLSPLQETGVKVDPVRVNTSGWVTVTVSVASQPSLSLTVIV